MSTITITISVDVPEGSANVQVESGTAPSAPATVSAGDGAALSRTVKRLTGKVSRRFIRHVAEAGLRGETVTVNDALAARFGFTDGGSLGGAIGSATTALGKALGNARWPLDRISVNPSVWRMTEADARVILAALDESDRG